MRLPSSSGHSWRGDIGIVVIDERGCSGAVGHANIHRLGSVGPNADILIVPFRIDIGVGEADIRVEEIRKTDPAALIIKDIPLLIDHFLSAFALRFDTERKSVSKRAFISGQPDRSI